MATYRFYYSSTTAADVSPAFDSDWGETASAVRRKLKTTPAGTGSSGAVGAAETSATQIDVLNGQFISDSDVLPAGPIAGTFDHVISCRASGSGAADMFQQIRIHVFDSTGATKRGTLYDGLTQTSVSATNSDPNGEFAFSAQDTRILDNVAIVAGTTAQAGDRLVVEFGARACNTSTTSRTSTIDFRDDGVSDHALTAGLTANGRPWIELDLVTDVSVAPPAATATAQGEVPTLALDTTISAPTATATAQGQAPILGGHAANIVEIAFNSGYSTPAASHTWTDVTDYVLITQGIDDTYGRSDEQGQADANTLRLVLKNSDGRFTPDLSTSPHYPNVKIGRPIRVTTRTAAGVSSVRFLGYIDDWTLEWPATVDTFATAAVSATSRIARMGTSAPLGNHIYEEFKRDSPVAHYMLDNLADSVAGGVALTQVGTGTAVAFEGTGPTDGIQAAQFAAGKYLRAVPNLSSAGFTSCLIECFFSTTTAPAGPTGLVGVGDGDLIGRIGITATGVSAQYRAAGGPFDLSEALAEDDGQTRHLAIVIDAGVGARLLVDGVEVDSVVNASVVLPNPRDIIVGGPYIGATEVFAGTLAHASITFATSAITTARVLAHANSGLTGFAGETAEARLQRYAAFAGIPTAEQSFSTAADTPMAYIDSTGQTVLSLMQKVAETDGGVLYDSRDGILTYAARSVRYNATAAVTLDASASQVEASYAPKLDRSALINEVVATIADGSDPQETVTAKDQDSYDDYGPHRQDIELATTSADEAHAAAWWKVNTYGEPRARAPQLGVEIEHLSTALQASILALKVGDKITITNLPSQSDAASKSYFVEGCTERIEPATHRLEFNISPTTGFDVWVLDSATLSQLDSTTKLAY